MKTNKLTSSPYSKMYLVGPAVYEKLLQCLDEIDKKQTLTLNSSEQSTFQPERPSERYMTELSSSMFSIPSEQKNNSNITNDSSLYKTANETVTEPTVEISEPPSIYETPTVPKKIKQAIYGPPPIVGLKFPSNPLNQPCENKTGSLNCKEKTMNSLNKPNSTRIKSFVNEEVDIRCELCGRYFTRTSSLKRHMERMHGGEDMEIIEENDFAPMRTSSPIPINAQVPQNETQLAVVPQPLPINQQNEQVPVPVPMEVTPIPQVNLNTTPQVEAPASLHVNYVADQGQPLMRDIPRKRKLQRTIRPVPADTVKYPNIPPKHRFQNKKLSNIPWKEKGLENLVHSNFFGNKLRFSHFRDYLTQARKANKRQIIYSDEEDIPLTERFPRKKKFKAALNYSDVEDMPLAKRFPRKKLTQRQIKNSQKIRKARKNVRKFKKQKKQTLVVPQISQIQTNVDPQMSQASVTLPASKKATKRSAAKAEFVKSSRIPFKKTHYETGTKRSSSDANLPLKPTKKKREFESWTR